MESSSAAPGPGGRFYKSRKSRPCDSCRRRKVACDMPLGPPCHRCSSRGLSCTFEHGPGERKRRQARALTGGVMQEQQQQQQQQVDGNHGYLGDMDPSNLFPLDPSVCMVDTTGLLLDHLSLPDGGPVMGDFTGVVDDGLFRSPRGNISQSSPQSDSSLSRNSNSAQSRDGPSPNVSVPEGLPSTGESLELVPDAFSFYVGPTGAADVHLLRRQEFDSNNMTRPKIPGLKYRRLEPTTTATDDGLDQQATIFGITDQSLLLKAEPRADNGALDAAWTELWSIMGPDTAWRLIKLYSRFVDPYFPILSSHQLPSGPEELSNTPLGLLAAMCASALPFVVYDETLYGLLLHPPSSSQLYRICWLDITQHLHSPTLATLQACLLLQQRLPTNAYLSDTAFAWSLMATSLAVAQTVGLHRDPMAWATVPLWERRLRRRLWWAVWMMERWISLVRGMPSHISDSDDFDVADLTPDAIADSLSSSPHTKTHLCQMVELTQILANIQRTYYTVRTMGRTSNDLQLSLDLARTPRAQLKAWLDNAGPSIPFLARTPWDNSSSSNNANTTSSSNDRARFRPQDTMASNNPTAQHELDGSGSIHLCYIVTHMTLFRALLRPLEGWHRDGDDDSVRRSRPERTEVMLEGARAVVRGSLLCVRDFVGFLEGLRDAQWNAFWHSWSRPNFAIAGSFMVHLLHVTSSSSSFGQGQAQPSLQERELEFGEEDRELRALVRRWRMAIRVSANGAAGARGLANLGLLRVETMLGRLVVSNDT
ncbi:hypothetical protein ACO1O0_007715 [Amphichorda felina]